MQVLQGVNEEFDKETGRDRDTIRRQDVHADSPEVQKLSTHFIRVIKSMKAGTFRHYSFLVNNPSTDRDTVTGESTQRKWIHTRVSSSGVEATVCQRVAC